MKKTDVYIGIDPDIDKNGVAFVEVETRRCEVSSLTFPELMDYLAFVVQRHEETGQTVTVVVEAGWLEESNWHLRQKGVAWAASVGRAVGRNHQAGIIIADMAEHIGLPVIRQRPLRKCWRGKDRKITHAELAAFTGIMGRTNQEERDALLLAWVAAGLPIKIFR